MDPQETKIYLAALIASGVLGIILVYFIFTIIRQQRISRKLHQEKIQAEIMTLEKERARIASDLHDDLGPVLSAIKFKINSVDLHGEEDKEIIDKASQQTDEVINRMREITYNLLPDTLLRKGLVHATEEFIGKLQPITKIKLGFSHNEIPSLPKNILINLYRVIQELIYNTIKHSQATSLTIELKHHRRKLFLWVTDNGIGFDSKKQQLINQGLGLRNIASRTEIMDGEIIMESVPHKGSKTTIEIPLNL